MSGRGSIYAFRAMALLAIASAVVTGALLGLHRTPMPRLGARLARLGPRMIVAPGPDGAVVPIATVLPPPDAGPPRPVWPPPLLNPEARLRLGWELSQGRPASHEILFTFDDGPSPGTTDRLLGILDRAGVHAVFFVVGWRLEQEEPQRARARALLQDIVARGHVVGSHTVRHRILPQLEPGQIAYEIDHNADVIEEVIHQRPHLFRPPYGAYSEDVRRHVAMRGHELWMWSIDSHDWQHVGKAEEVAQIVINAIGNHAGGTILLHDTHPWSVAAVPKILQWIREANRDREAEHRPTYTIMDAARFLEGARERLPLALATEAALAGRERHDGGPRVEPTTGPIAEGTVAAPPVRGIDAGAGR